MKNTYKEYLEKQKLPKSSIENQLSIVNEFMNFLNSRGIDGSQTTKNDMYDYADHLIKKKQNTVQTFEALRGYADFIDNRLMYVAFIEILDGWNVMEVLSHEIKKTCGEEIHNKVFIEEFPLLGVNETERYHYTAKIMERMSQYIPAEKNKNAWFKVQHGLKDSDFNDAKNRELYHNCADFDDFLQKKREERDERLTTLKNENSLWYTLEINDEVLEFIKGNPEIEVGRREGNFVYITKVPYNPIKYLHEKDEKVKRYYACHCPWVREAILNDTPISSEICYCSVGHASHYLSGPLNQKIEGKILESALKGDLRCRFVFELPAGIK